MWRSRDEAISALATWIRYELPKLNMEVEGADDFSILVTRFTPLCRGVEALLRGNGTSPVAARRLLQLLAFGVSSVERHSQWCRNQPGEGVKLLGVDELLEALGTLAEQPPRDTYGSYWLNNGGSAPLTFTGSYQEVLFNRVVNDTEAAHRGSANALTPLCLGQVSLDSPEAVDATEFAILNHERLSAAFKGFMKPSVDRPSEWAMTAEFFAYKMRTYLMAFPVGGVVWSGPNAANIPGQALCDFAIGTVDDEYRATIRSRFPLLHRSDREELDRAMTAPSLLDRTLERVGLTIPQLVAVPTGELTARFTAQPRLIPFLSAYAELVKAAGQLSATHFALIHNYLRRTADRTAPDIAARLPVPLDKGTGTMRHDDTRRIMEMRKNHPYVSRLTAAVA